MAQVVLAATADIHSPKYLDEFLRAVDSFEGTPDLILLAGDVVYRGRVEEFAKVLEPLESLGSRILAIFGNEEYDDLKPRFLEAYGDRVQWLDDQGLEVEIRGLRLWIVGSRGSLKRPTTWQSRHIPGIEEIYRARVSLLDELLAEAGGRKAILMTHYAPTFRTLVGENPKIWSRLGHPGLERVIKRRRPALVVHGHAHNGSKEARVNSVPVYNVSFPVWREIVKLTLPLTEEVGLESYMI